MEVELTPELVADEDVVAWIRFLHLGDVFLRGSSSPLP
jgi:hypothetical protein